MEWSHGTASEYIGMDISKYKTEQEEKKKKMTAFIYNLERLLNMEQGSMEEIIRPLFGQK